MSEILYLDFYLIYNPRIDEIGKGRDLIFLPLGYEVGFLLLLGDALGPHWQSKPKALKECRQECSYKRSSHARICL